MKKIKNIVNSIYKKVSNLCNIALNFVKEGTQESTLRLESISLFIVTSVFMFKNVELLSNNPSLQRFVIYLYIICFGFKSVHKAVELIPKRSNKNDK